MTDISLFCRADITARGYTDDETIRGWWTMVQVSDMIRTVFYFLTVVLLILSLAKRKKERRDNSSADDKVKKGTDKYFSTMMISLALLMFSLVFTAPGPVLMQRFGFHANFQSLTTWYFGSTSREFKLLGAPIAQMISSVILTVGILSMRLARRLMTRRK